MRYTLFILAALYLVFSIIAYLINWNEKSNKVQKNNFVYDLMTIGSLVLMNMLFIFLEGLNIDISSIVFIFFILIGFVGFIKVIIDIKKLKTLEKKTDYYANRVGLIKVDISLFLSFIIIALLKLI